MGFLALGERLCKVCALHNQLVAVVIVLIVFAVLVVVATLFGRIPLTVSGASCISATVAAAVLVVDLWLTMAKQQLTWDSRSCI